MRPVVRELVQGCRDWRAYLAHQWARFQGWILARDCYQPASLPERLHRAADGCPMSCSPDVAELMREAAYALEGKGP